MCHQQYLKGYFTLLLMSDRLTEIATCIAKSF